MDNDKDDSVARNLEILNERLRRQTSVWYTLRNGVAYGMGFMVGSILITSVVISIILHFFGDTILSNVVLWFAERAQ